MFQNNIKKIRKSKGVSGTFLAEQCGITRDYLYKVESGNKNGSILLYKNVAKVLQVPIDALVNID